jgi:isochorismate pyruvate lyase
MAASIASPTSRLLLLDSIGYIAQPGFEIADKVIVSGSHGGTAAAGYILDHSQKPRLVCFNDAGGGKDAAGFAGLDLLQSVQVAACTYSHLSARIGQAEDGLAHGVISHCNAIAFGMGLSAGNKVQMAIEPFLGSGDSHSTTRSFEHQSSPPKKEQAEPDPFGPPLRQFLDPSYQEKAKNLAELRIKIDDLDESIIALLAQRAMLVKDAARFKANHFQVSAPQRQAEVFAKARQRAMRHNPGFEGFEEVVEQSYRTMVAQFIAKESLYFDQLIAI